MAHRGVHDVLVAEVARDTADLVRRLDDYKRGHETPLTRSKQRLAPRVKALCLGPNMYRAQYVQGPACLGPIGGTKVRSEEHTSELQTRGHLVCRLLLAKKNRILHSHRHNSQTAEQT